MKTASIFLAVCCCLSAASSQLPEASRLVADGTPGFDPRDVIRQVRSAQSFPRTLGTSDPSADDGEFLIDTSITLSPAPIYQEYPAVAFDGTNFLVVWEDIRNGLDCDIYGTRVTSAGVVLDPNGMPISVEAGHQEYPAIAFRGGNFLVVWQDKRSGSFDVYGARVTPSGVVLDTAGIAISVAPDHQSAPALAADSANFLVVWEDRRGDDSADIYGARVTLGGSVLDPAGFAIAVAAENQRGPAVAFDGVNFLAAWGDDRAYDTLQLRQEQDESGSAPPSCAIYGSRVTPAGAVLDTAGFTISQAANDQDNPAVAFDGDNFLVVWRDERNGRFQPDVYGSRVTPAGAVLDEEGIVISAATFDQWDPALAFGGENFLVTWTDGRSGSGAAVFGARVTPAGRVLDSTGIALSPGTYEWAPAVAFGGGNLMVTWADVRGSDVYAARVTSGGVVLDTGGIDISIATNVQYDPALAFDGQNFLVVWGDGRSSSDVYGARVTPDGAVLDALAIPIATTPDNEYAPGIAFDGENYQVIWEHRTNHAEVYGSRVTPDGVVLDTQRILIPSVASDKENAAIAFGGVNYLVVWQDDRNGFDDIYGARVTPAGVVLDLTGFPVTTAPDWQAYPAVAYDGANFLVVYADRQSGSYVDIYGARVTPAGAVLDTPGVAISTATGEQSRPALASDGENCLVVWNDKRSGLYDIYGTRVTPSADVLDSSGIAIGALASHWGSAPAIAFDGDAYLTTWGSYSDSTSDDIHGARVTPGGAVFERGAVVSLQGDQHMPALARGPGRDLFLVYDGWAGIVGGKTYNADRIWGKMDPNPAVAELTKPKARRTNGGATIVRGVLDLGVGSGLQAVDRAELLDVGGRMVMGLRPGANDVRGLAPGVYFVRGPKTEDGRPVSAVRKIVIAK